MREKLCLWRKVGRAGALLLPACHHYTPGPASGHEHHASPITPPSPLSPSFFLQTFSVQDGESFVSFFPGPTARLSVGIDRQAVAPVIGRQWFSWTPEPAAPAEGAEEGDSEHFRWEVAPARTTFDSIDVSRG